MNKEMQELYGKYQNRLLAFKQAVEIYSHTVLTGSMEDALREALTVSKGIENYYNEALDQVLRVMETIPETTEEGVQHKTWPPK